MSQSTYEPMHSSEHESDGAPDAAAVFEAHGIVKTFPGVVALDDVSLTLAHGSIHALLGENGAGKSTLIKAITGVHRPDAGTMRLDGAPFVPGSPRDAIALGIGVVHQERNLIPRFSIGENLFLERLSANPMKRIDYPALYRDACQWLELLEIDVDPATRIDQLSVARMQLVEIARALSLKSKILLLDEPTASLTSHETDKLFEILGRLRDDGASLIFVSHKLEEVQQICDRVTVLRDGRNACESQPMTGLDRQDIVRLMIGRSEMIPDWSMRDATGRKPALELQQVCTRLGHEAIDMRVREGEILGLYGLVGAGRSELAKCILGKHAVTGGTIRVAGEVADIRCVADAVRTYRIGYVSEDRKSEGLILMHSILDNVGMTVWRRLAKAGSFLTQRSVARHAQPSIDKLEVRTPSLEQLLANLSGGNQQKVSVAKWLAAEVKILIIDEPSVGIDIKTKGYLHELVRELAESGTAILLITSDMPEMIAVADRIAVMGGYRMKGELVNTRDYRDMSEGIMALIQRVDGAAAPLDATVG